MLQIRNEGGLNILGSD
ncbi:hypothetical protein [Plasmodium yoelii yoelii]|uniref:Uncharacterized protein n=1 Tax=Plasmodium yoelii yoelii TaxID=73239 RepID=Q7RHS3_PLAYO|nr:hypothetical protein [Plasmodium yoelii yoelii]